MALWEAVFSGLFYGQLWENKVHFESLEGAFSAESIANLLDPHWVDHMKTFQQNLVTWNSIQVKSIGQVQQEQFTKALNKQGAQAGEGQEFTFVAGVIQKKTGFAGKGMRGRIYVPGIRGGATQFGKFQQFELDNWTITCNNLKAQWIDPLPHNIRLVIKHPEGSTPVNALAMRPILGVMRSRNIGVGS